MRKLLLMSLLVGGFAGASPVQNAFADAEVIKVGDVWRYCKGTKAPPKEWKSIAFDDHTWAEGSTGIGYSTDIQYPTSIADMRGNYWSIYARRKFFVADANDVSALRLGIRYDDGFVAYINGTEIARSINMVGPVRYDTEPAFAHDEGTAEEFFTQRLTPGLLLSGENVLAIECHNYNISSSDLGIVPRLIVVDNLLPEASIQIDYPPTGMVPLTVDFDASGSRDPDGRIVECSWDFGDGTPKERGSGTLRRHTYHAQGAYECVLEVTDNKGGKNTASVTIVVGPPRTVYVDGSMTGSLDASGNAIGTYDPATRRAGQGSETAYNTFMEASLTAAAGDTIAIRAGTYNETLRPMRSGNAAAPITYINYKDELVVIRDTPGIKDLTADEVALDQPGRDYGIYMYDVSHVVIEGLHVNNITGWCRVVRSDHIILRRNTFTAALGHGTTGGVKFYLSDHNKIINNTLRDGNDNLMLIHSDRNLVEGNSIVKARHSIWSIKGGNYNVVRGNYFHNEIQKIGEVFDVESSKDTPIKYDAAHHNLVDGNTFAKTASSGNHSPFAGIQYAGQHGIIRRNLFYETTGPGLDFTLYAKEARYNYGNRVYNNVFHKTDFAGISISESQSYTFHGNCIKNNILYRSLFVANDKRWIWYTRELTEKPIQLLTGRLNGFVFENNSLFNRQRGEAYLITYGSRNSKSNRPQHDLSWWEKSYPAVFKNNLEEDPLFVDAANHDYKLADRSPMIDAGAFLTVINGPGGSGDQLTVADAGYFYDGYGIVGERGDLIKLENGQMARILGIDYGAADNVITLDRRVSWRAGEKVSLDYNGAAPDIGAYEK